MLKPSQGTNTLPAGAAGGSLIEGFASLQVSSGKFTTIGVGVLLTTTHRNGSREDVLISMWSR
jgi:hypothetical protein